MANPAPATRSRGPSLLERLGKHRWHATKKMPYLARALYACTYIESEQVPTMAVDDRWRVYVNPHHFAECERESADAAMTGVIHEALHPFLHHKKRFASIHATDHAHSNRCGDCELVQCIQGAQIKIWSKDLTPEMMGWPRGLSAEEYYKLPRNEQSGDGKGTANGPCSAGSGANGVKMPWELGEGKPGPAGLSEAEADIVRAQVAQAIREHAEQKGRGSVPSGLLRWAEQMAAPPVIDWRDIIAGRVSYHIDTRLGPMATYSRPSRRDSGGLVLPIHRTPRANIVVVGDTSGSMGDTDIGKVIGVVWDATQVLGTVRALGCDAAATEPVEVHHIDDLRDALRGGGGTSMVVGIDKAEESNPDAIVVVTDGGTDWPSTPTNCPLVIVLTQKAGSYGCQPPAWADVIDASDL